MLVPSLSLILIRSCEPFASDPLARFKSVPRDAFRKTQLPMVGHDFRIEYYESSQTNLTVIDLFADDSRTGVFDPVLVDGDQLGRTTELLTSPQPPTCRSERDIHPWQSEKIAARDDLLAVDDADPY
jgi:hypothetical protein